MVTLRSPAKINLALRVVGKRPDGYHELNSLFQAVSLFDTLTISCAQEDSFSCSDSSLPLDHTNLVLKAVQLFRKNAGKTFPVKIHLEKHIPVQAGLGGGSGNAATTLWALNKLGGDILSEAELQAWSAEIGSDIPFFFSQGTALCTGRGERVQPLKALPKTSLWIVKPQQGLSTQEVYKNLNVDKLKKSFSDEGFAKLPQKDVFTGLMSFAIPLDAFFNDLEEPAFHLMPSLKALKRDLQNLGFSSVVMSGSGTAFFCHGNIEKSLPQGLSAWRVDYVNRKHGEWY